MTTKDIDFLIDDYSVFATGEYDEESDEVINIEYECNLEVDEEMEKIILQFSERLLKEKFERDELYFT